MLFVDSKEQSTTTSAWTSWIDWQDQQINELTNS
jgi:hypothetical protein